MYEPREDSHALAEQVRRFAKGIVLDVGTGTGIQAKAAAEKEEVTKVYAVDINKKSLTYCKRNIKNKKIEFLHSDLLSVFEAKKFSGLRFDTIIFNPPYLPDDKGKKDVALIGGKKGYETIEMFLPQAVKFLKPDGIILLLFSSLTNKNRVIELIEENLLEFKELSTTRLFFEELYVQLLKKTSLLVALEKKKVADAAYLAKGKRGVIFTGIFEGKKIAIKKKNEDSEAHNTVENETAFLKIMNANNIGPAFLFKDENYLAYEFASGEHIKDWIPKAKKSAIQKVLIDVFVQCFKMDELKISKEEMHHPLKHVIVGRKNVLIDFERAHYSDDPKNVTQFCQFVITWERTLNKKGFHIQRNKIIALAMKYSRNKSKDNLERIIEALK